MPYNGHICYRKCLMPFDNTFFILDMVLIYSTFSIFVDTIFKVSI